jgi:hypothetical protein
MSANKWRGFANDFAPGEVRYDEFEGATGTADTGANRPAAATVSKTPHPSTKTIQELLSGVQDKEQRMRALRKHIDEEQKKQQRREERRKQRLQEEADEWQKKNKEIEGKAREERKQNLQRLAAANVRTKKSSRVHDSSSFEPTTTIGESTVLEGEESSFFLTGLGDAEMPVIPPEYRDRIRLPPMPKFTRFKRGNFSLPKKAAIPHFKKKDGGKKKDDWRLPRLVDDDGKLSSVIPNPEEPTMPVKDNLRKAQARMLKQLSGSVSFYRAHMRKHFQRILEASELQFGDAVTRRKQASWNLAKPLSITEIKQMAAAKIQQ